MLQGPGQNRRHHRRQGLVKQRPSEPEDPKTRRPEDPKTRRPEDPKTRRPEETARAGRDGRVGASHRFKPSTGTVQSFPNSKQTTPQAVFPIVPLFLLAPHEQFIRCSHMRSRVLMPRRARPVPMVCPLRRHRAGNKKGEARPLCSYDTVACFLPHNHGAAYGVSSTFLSTKEATKLLPPPEPPTTPATPAG